MLLNFHEASSYLLLNRKNKNYGILEFKQFGKLTFMKRKLQNVCDKGIF